MREIEVAQIEILDLLFKLFLGPGMVFFVFFLLMVLMYSSYTIMNGYKKTVNLLKFQLEDVSNVEVLFCFEILLFFVVNQDHFLFLVRKRANVIFCSIGQGRTTTKRDALHSKKEVCQFVGVEIRGYKVLIA